MYGSLAIGTIEYAGALGGSLAGSSTFEYPQVGIKEGKQGTAYLAGTPSVKFAREGKPSSSGVSMGTPK